jgi:hypothetical protein
MSACLSFWGEKIPDTTPTFPAKCSAVAASMLNPNCVANQVMRFTRVSVFGAIVVLDKVAGVRIKNTTPHEESNGSNKLRR